MLPMPPMLRRILLLLCLSVVARLLRQPRRPCRVRRSSSRTSHFWIRVYSEISHQRGLHPRPAQPGGGVRDAAFRRDVPPRERQARSMRRASSYQAACCGYLAAGAAPRNAEEQRVREPVGARPRAGALLAGRVDDVRFQLGQSDRFRAGLERSGAWEAHIARDARQPRACRRSWRRCRMWSPRSTRRPIRRSAPPACGSSCAPPGGASCASTTPWTSAWIRSAPPRRRRSCWPTTTACSAPGRWR